jgi:hypothetical protein
MNLTGITGNRIFINNDRVLSVHEIKNDQGEKYTKIIMSDDHYLVVKENFNYVVSMIEEGKGRC